MPDILYEVRSYAKDKDKLCRWSGFYSRQDAEDNLANILRDRVEWSNQYHRDWHIAEIDVTGMFVMPSPELPRDRFRCQNTKVKHSPGKWDTRQCQAIDDSTGNVVAEWHYGYSGKPPFEPFRQGDKFYALMSEHYTATSVMDLQTGQVIAAEPAVSNGFCPVGFYVPDWWDIHDDSIKPGSEFWEDSDEQPSGQYGFVWGCIWGDDSSWKLENLDLSRVQQGEIHRDDRFGYLELAAIGDDPREYIRVSIDGHVTFATWQYHDLATGQRRGYDDRDA